MLSMLFSRFFLSHSRFARAYAFRQETNRMKRCNQINLTDDVIREFTIFIRSLDLLLILDSMDWARFRSKRHKCQTIIVKNEWQIKQRKKKKKQIRMNPWHTRFQSDRKEVNTSWLSISVACGSSTQSNRRDFCFFFSVSFILSLNGSTRS